MDFFDLVTEVIDLRSFSNLWYWIVLAILWSTMSHWVVGVPFHIVARARRGHDASIRDMQALAKINAQRILTVTEVSGPVVTGIAAFVLTALAVTGWVYRVEFSQAVFLLLFPAVLVGMLTIVTARKLRADGFENTAKILRTHRLLVQVLGVLFIFVTAFWGMWQNINVGPLG